MTVFLIFTKKMTGFIELLSRMFGIMSVISLFPLFKLTNRDGVSVHFIFDIVYGFSQNGRGTFYQEFNVIVCDNAECAELDSDYCTVVCM